MILIGLKELVKLATCAMWNLSLIKQHNNGKLLEGDSVFYRTKCSNFQDISQVFSLCVSISFYASVIFLFVFPCVLCYSCSGLEFRASQLPFWPPSDSVIIVPKSVIRTRDGCMTNLPRGGTLTCSRAFVLPQWTRPRMTSEQSWLLPGSLGIFLSRKKRKLFPLNNWVNLNPTYENLLYTADKSKAFTENV